MIGSCGAMTTEDRVKECESEGGEQQPGVKQPVEQVGECAAEEKGEELKEEPGFVVVDSVFAVETVFEQDGKVEDVCRDEVKVKPTFASEEPEPYGPDEYLQDGKVQQA